MSIGERLMQARKSQGLSMRTLAEKAGISAMAISKYEREQDVPSSGVLLRLSEALNVHVEYFFRPATTPFRLKVFHKAKNLSVKSLNVIQAQIEEWLERYYQVESMFPDQQHKEALPERSVKNLAEVEEAAANLRQAWQLGLDPIDNLSEVLEDHGVKVKLVEGVEGFEAASFLAGGTPVIVCRASFAVERQRFDLGQELGYLILKPFGGLDPEEAAGHFVRAFLAPAPTILQDLGAKRMAVSPHELNLLQQEYGLPIQALVHRAEDLGITTPSTAKSLLRQIRGKGWQVQETGNEYIIERPTRFERLVYRALAEDLISRSRAQELLGKPIDETLTL